MKTFRIAHAELAAMQKAAIRPAQRGREICGMLIAQGAAVTLLPVKNTGGWGSFEMRYNWWTRALRAKGYSTGQYRGTYHSHAWSSAHPGKSDLQNITHRTHMLILCVENKNYLLWQVRPGHCKPARIFTYKPSTPLP